jgi:hypothetical protein
MTTALPQFSVESRAGIAHIASQAKISSKSLSRRTLSLQADLAAVHGASAGPICSVGSAGDMGTAQPILVDIDFRRSLLYVSTNIRWSANKRTNRPRNPGVIAA